MRSAYALKASFLRVAIRCAKNSLLVGLIPGWLLLSVIPAQAETILTASYYSVSSLKKEGTWKISKGVMANGEKFNDDKFTCATQLFPLHSILRITSLENKKTVVVLVTDRIGKRFAKTRIDLSRRAFMEIAGGEQGLKKGLLQVSVEEVKHDSNPALQSQHPGVRTAGKL